MPWNEVNLMSLRREFIHFATQAHANLSGLCRRFGLSRKTTYKWLQRFHEYGDEILRDRPRRRRAAVVKNALLPLNPFATLRCVRGCSESGIRKRDLHDTLIFFRGDPIMKKQRFTQLRRKDAIRPFRDSLTLTLSRREREFEGCFSSLISKRREPLV
ncbi:MAG TPA: helix-turn-helix domain-containing protein [bacterium]|mgnify:CR=1 FL=1|nr:helix-turn-helix domain-containing protein [Candidatus Omnitrophota bacterium]HOJ59657.1 helix-turn-helix domain-containing protein [bacterium]